MQRTATGAAAPAPVEVTPAVPVQPETVAPAPPPPMTEPPAVPPPAAPVGTIENKDLKPLPEKTTSGRPIERSEFIPAPVSAAPVEPPPAIAPALGAPRPVTNGQPTTAAPPLAPDVRLTGGQTEMPPPLGGTPPPPDAPTPAPPPGTLAPVPATPAPPPTTVTPPPAATPPPPPEVTPASVMAVVPDPPPTTPPAVARPIVSAEPVKVNAGGVNFRPAGPPPSVVKYDVTRHPCVQEDTWESISKKYLLDARYAEALQAYNRHNPQASERMRRDGLLAPGDFAYVPPHSVLEERHGSLIRKPEPATPMR